ncbi:MAG TPA: hypothetical protein VFN26_09405 [Candidatus Acidoferrum sp.]|nr:hypothetical protein [Candidatus Acidoferrum sp.]
MHIKDSNSWLKLQQKLLNRRNLIRGAAGTAAGAGLMLSSGLRLKAFADEEDEGEHNKCRALPRPIPHISTPPGAHFFFPGPPDGSAPSTFPHFPNAGFDPSTITDFKGVIAQADLLFGGTGTDLNTGDSAPYTFHTDWRFFKGTFVAIDGIEHHGTMTEI